MTFLQELWLPIQRRRRISGVEKAAGANTIQISSL